MSQISTDTIKGVTAANNITLGNTPIVSASANSLTIRREGSNQQNVQQGLTKVWCHWVNDTSQATGGIYDSLNVSGLTDVQAGGSRLSYTTNMGQAVYSVPVGGMHDGGSYVVDVYLDHDEPPQTGQVDFDILQESTNAGGVGTRIDDGLWSMCVLGDLS